MTVEAQCRDFCAALFATSANLARSSSPDLEIHGATEEEPDSGETELADAMAKVRLDSEEERKASLAAKQASAEDARFLSEEVTRAAVLAVETVCSASLSLSSLNSQSEADQVRKQIQAASDAAPSLLKFDAEVQASSEEMEKNSGCDSCEVFFQELLALMRRDGSLARLQDLLRRAVKNCLKRQLRKDALLAAAFTKSDLKSPDSPMLLHRKNQVLAETFSQVTEALNLHVNKIVK